MRELTPRGRPYRAHMRMKRVHVTCVSGPGGGQREGERDEGTYQTPDSPGCVEMEREQYLWAFVPESGSCPPPFLCSSRVME